MPVRACVDQVPDRGFLIARHTIHAANSLPGTIARSNEKSLYTIAAYDLCLTIESMSRALSQLRGAGVLDFIGKTQRKIIVRDRLRLTSFDMPA
jgi:CRP-like cAMP-binding protein